MNIGKKGNIELKEIILGWFGWQMSGQPMIFPFVQYSLIFNIHLIHDLALKISPNGRKVQYLSYAYD